MFAPTVVTEAAIKKNARLCTVGCVDFYCLNSQSRCTRKNLFDLQIPGLLNILVSVFVTVLALIIVLLVIVQALTNRLVEISDAHQYH